MAKRDGCTTRCSAGGSGGIGFPLLLLSVLLAASALQGMRCVSMRGGLRIEKQRARIAATKKTIRGDIVVRNAALEVENSHLTLELPYDEAHSIRILGRSEVRVSKSRIESQPYQFYVECRSLPSGSPKVVSREAEWLNHAGIRLYGSSIFAAEGGEVAELQMHDRSQAYVRKAYVYPVFFPGSGPFHLAGLRLGDSVCLDVVGPSGWRFRADSCAITGYHVDIPEGCTLQIVDSEGIGISLHSTGHEPRVTYLSSLTSEVPRSFGFSAFGASVEVVQSQIATLNIYVVGSDTVVVRDCVVNEAQTDGSAVLSLIGGQCYYDLVQARDASTLLLEEVQPMRWPDNSGGSVLAMDHARVIFRRCGVGGLTLTAMGSARIELIECSGVDSLRIRQVGNGRIRIAPPL
ncbi:MAG: hypothetical protein ONB23_07810 [candidate division KSB1 bacterium]|nr:hypothetical protein [candidate division KSB1 bacterium]